MLAAAELLSLLLIFPSTPSSHDDYVILMLYFFQGREPTDLHIKQVCMRVIQGK